VGGVSADRRRTTICIADDARVVRTALRCLLEQERDLHVTGESDDGLGVLRLVERLRPDVLLVDVLLPGLYGLEVTRRVRAQVPATAVIVLSRYASAWYVVEALRNGAAGYVVKQAEAVELVRAIRAVAAGHHYLSTPLSRTPVERWLRHARAFSGDPYQALTNREREVLQLVAEGHTSPAIARRLRISPRTVESHRAAVMHKLGIKSHGALIRYALARGVVPPPEPLAPDLAAIAKIDRS
jgi:DNA-binding NarL/FixJ family response regulator